MLLWLPQLLNPMKPMLDPPQLAWPPQPQQQNCQPQRPNQPNPVKSSTLSTHAHPYRAPGLSRTGRPRAWRIETLKRNTKNNQNKTAKAESQQRQQALHENYINKQCKPIRTL